VHSNTATRRNIDNNPNAEQLAAMKLVTAKVFQPVREWYGKPIRVNSFFRSPELNTRIGGSKTSQHCKGEAIDIDTSNDNKKLYDYIRDNLEYDQLIWEFGNESNPDWIHVSFSKNGNRKRQLLAKKVNGRTTYSVS
jgi:zinc D-Ala-D-Ala carboxypeptidase